MNWFCLQVLILQTLTVSAATPEFQRYSKGCAVCAKINQQLEAYNVANDSGLKMKVVYNVSQLIKGIQLKGLAETEQKREIYYAIHATEELLREDFDADNSVQLAKLRSQNPKAFDFVFHHFSTSTQKSIRERMNAAIEDKILPKSSLPEIKEN